MCSYQLTCGSGTPMNTIGILHSSVVAALFMRATREKLNGIRLQFFWNRIHQATLDSATSRKVISFRSMNLFYVKNVRF